MRGRDTQIAIHRTQVWRLVPRSHQLRLACPTMLRRSFDIIVDHLRLIGVIIDYELLLLCSVRKVELQTEEVSQPALFAFFPLVGTCCLFVGKLFYSRCIETFIDVCI